MKLAQASQRGGVRQLLCQTQIQYLPETRQQFPCSSQSLNRTQTNHTHPTQDYCPVWQQLGQTADIRCVMLAKQEFVPLSEDIK